MNNTLVCTSIGEGKAYTLPFVKNQVRLLAGDNDILYVHDDRLKLPTGYFKDIKPNETVTKIKVTDGPNIVRPVQLAEIREAARQRFLEGEYDYLYFHDSDMIIPDIGMITRMQDRMRATGKHIVANAYILRTFEYPIFVILEEDSAHVTNGHWEKLIVKSVPADGYGAAYGVGFGSVLLSREVARAVPFRTDYTGLDLTWYGEDFAFCQDATAQFSVDGVPDINFGAGIWHVAETGYGGRIVLGPPTEQIRNVESGTKRNQYGEWPCGVWRTMSPGMGRDLVIGYERTSGCELRIETMKVEDLCKTYSV